MTKIIENKFKGKEIAETGYLLDGFPRTVKQAQDLDVILKRIAQPVDYVVSMEVDSEIVIQRLTGRRICRNCAAVYHLKNMPSKKEGICDKCQGSLTQRQDDINNNSINKRLQIYHEEINPVLKFYNTVRANGAQPVERVTEDIQKAIKMMTLFR